MRLPLPLSNRLVALLGTVVFCAGFANTASAEQEVRADRPELLSRLVTCRAVAASDARLACYDAAAEALDTAERQGAVVVVDRAEVRATRRRLFGFELPSAEQIDSGPAPERIDSIETTLTRAYQNGNDKWVFVLADGSTWRQIDSEGIDFRNRPGQPIRVNRAALGSYLLTVGRGGSVRVRRQ